MTRVVEEYNLKKTNDGNWNTMMTEKTWCCKTSRWGQRLQASAATTGSYGGGGGTQINMLFIPDQMLGFIFLQLWPKDGFDKKLFLSKNQKIQERAFFLSFFFFSFFLFTWNFVQNVIRVFSLQLGNLFFKAFQPFWRHYFTYFKPISAHQWMLSLSFLISRLKVSIC